MSERIEPRGSREGKTGNPRLRLPLTVVPLNNGGWPKSVSRLRLHSQRSMPTYVVFYNGAVYGYTAAEPPREGERIVLDRGGDTVLVRRVRFGDRENEIAIHAEPDGGPRP